MTQRAITDGTGHAATPTGVSILSDSPIADPRRDFFGFRVYADAIASLIDNELTDTPLTIAISAPWGGGKTSVARMLKERLEKRAASRGNDRPIISCWFDAWMHNDAPNLGAALATATVRTANDGRPGWRRLLSPVPSAMLRPSERWRRRVYFGIAAIVVGALTVVVGPLREPLLSLPALKEAKAANAGSLVASALLALFVARNVFGIARDAASFVDDPRSEAARGSMAEVREQLGELIGQARRGGRLVIYVDNLERCSPDRALEACEVANQLLGHEGVVAILIADMHAVATAAAARYPANGTDAAVGQRFLEKIVQIQIALPPPHRDHMRRLLRGDSPDDVFSREASSLEMASPAATHASESLGVATARGIARIGDQFVKLAVVAISLLPLLVLTGATAIDVTSAKAVTAILLVSAPLFVFTGAQAFLWWRALRARRQQTVIRDLIRNAVEDRPTPEALELRILDAVEPAYHDLALNELQNYRLDNSPELRGVVEVILRYPPELPRGAKRMLNHARLLTQLARDRHIFGGDPELTPAHLGEWIVLAERWPLVARKVSQDPDLMVALEGAANRAEVNATLERNGIEAPEGGDDLFDLVKRQPRLSDVLARLVHFEPSAALGDAEILGVDRGAQPTA